MLDVPLQINEMSKGFHLAIQTLNAAKIMDQCTKMILWTFGFILIVWKCLVHWNEMEHVTNEMQIYNFWFLQLDLIPKHSIFLLCCLIHYKSTLVSDQQNTPERSTSHSTAFLTVAISLDDNIVTCTVGFNGAAIEPMQINLYNFTVTQYKT